MREDIAVIVLAGGLGRRFGMPKIHAKVGDKTFLEAVLEVASQVGDPYVSVSQRLINEPLRISMARIIVDIELPIRCEGPIRGIVTSAYSLSDYSGLVFVPVDAIYITPRTLRLLVEAGERCGCPTTYYTGDGNVHSLYLYSPTEDLRGIIGYVCNSKSLKPRATSIVRAFLSVKLLDAARVGESRSILAVNKPEDLTSERKPPPPGSGSILLEGHGQLYRTAGDLRPLDAINNLLSEYRLYKSHGLNLLARHVALDIGEISKHIPLPDHG
ncbi:MAG: nucleotidyltransferase family protein [Aeropyrum sp.]|nr:nucleotidyltransferase family protein [Aeropyrum sp.]